MDLRQLDEAPADYFIVCQGDSTTQVESIATSIVKKCKEVLGESPSSVEGMGNGRWVIVDYFDTVVHIFYPETRQFYQLESLWNDAVLTQYSEETGAII